MISPTKTSKDGQPITDGSKGQGHVRASDRDKPRPATLNAEALAMSLAAQSLMWLTESMLGAYSKSDYSCFSRNLIAARSLAKLISDQFEFLKVGHAKDSADHPSDLHEECRDIALHAHALWRLLHLQGNQELDRVETIDSRAVLLLAADLVGYVEDFYRRQSASAS